MKSTWTRHACRHRGVKVRVYLDGTQLAERKPTKVFHNLAETPGIEIRIWRDYSAVVS